MQIDELEYSPPQPLITSEDFKAFSKIKVENHLFNEYVGASLAVLTCIDSLTSTWAPRLPC